MLKHTGSARDPFELAPSTTKSTQGLGWVVVGFVAICLIVAAAHSTGWLQDTAAHMAAAASSQG